LKQEKIWGLVILVLIALSGWVMLGKHTDPTTHQRVANYPTRYGLDIKGGIRAVLQAHPERAPGVAYNQDLIQHILENRINAAGVGEPVVQPRPQEKQFIIELPDVKNKNAVLEQLGTTAQMTFYYFADVQSDNPKTSSYPLRSSISRGVNGHEVYAFVATQPWNGFSPGESFRDGAQIKAATGERAQQRDQRMERPPDGLLERERRSADHVRSRPGAEIERAPGRDRLDPGRLPGLHRQRIGRVRQVHYRAHRRDQRHRPGRRSAVRPSHQ